jgi:NOL1/NOP2/fmu family ribosome biogenesis protein
MKNFKLLNSKDIKNLNKKLVEQFGNEFNFKKYVTFKTPKNRIYIVNKDIGSINYSQLKINNLGLYFMTIEKDGLRLSIDGSQIFEAKKNVIDLDESNFKNWMSGKDLDLDFENSYVILRYKNSNLGCGKSIGNRILNYVPKERRVVF